MILTMDAGNTTVSLALFDGDEILRRAKYATAQAASVNGCLQLLRRFLEGTIPDDAILSSVVPAVDKPLHCAAARFLGHEPVVMNEEVPTGIRFDRYDRKSIGSDRIADLAAAAQIAGAPVMTFDLGSCTTVTILDADREILGGMILPGIQMSLDAMHEHTGKLPQLQAAMPEALIGGSTAGCMESGAIIGTAAVIDEFIIRTRAVLGCEVPAVLTGGAGRLVLPWCRHSLHFEPDLLMKGLNRICREARRIPAQV